MNTEKSVIKVNQQEADDYLNNLAEAVCINGEALEKYKKVITKQYGEELYNNMKMFVEEVQRYVKRKKFTNTSKVNLSYLGENAGLSESIIDKIVMHYDNKKNKGNSKSKWIVLSLLALLGIGVFVFLYEKEEPLPLQVLNFVNQVEDNASSFNTDNWKKTSFTFDSLKHEYAIHYKKLSYEQLDLVDDAIDRFNVLFRKYREIPFEEDTTQIIVDGIEYSCEKPTKEDLYAWKEHYSAICAKKVSRMDNEDFYIPQDMLENHPCLVYLILESKSMSSGKKKQEWFDLYSLMNSEQVYSLYDILYRETYKFGKIEKKSAIRELASKFNSEAYEFAKDSDFYNAKITIDKAKMLMPDYANYYDSEGEFCIMQGRTERALSLWNKVMKLDPDFLHKTNGGTTILYEQLKELGLIEGIK